MTINTILTLVSIVCASLLGWFLAKLQTDVKELKHKNNLLELKIERVELLLEKAQLELEKVELDLTSKDKTQNRTKES